MMEGAWIYNVIRDSLIDDGGCMTLYSDTWIYNVIRDPLIDDGGCMDI